jgi:PKD repeat protein
MTRGAGFILLLVSCASLSGCFLLPQDPVVSMSVSPSSGYGPLPVHLEAHVESAQSDIVSYEWTFGDGTTAVGREVDREFTGIGIVSIHLAVTDARGRQTIVEGSVRLLNRLPHAQFTFQPNPAPTHHPIKFDASGSTDEDGAIVSYHWDFGDGNTAVGVAVEHAFEGPDFDYRVVLTVTDDSGDSNSAYRDIELIGCDH